MSPAYRVGFQEGAVANLSRHNQAHHLSVIKRLGRMDRQFIIIMYTWYIQPLETESNGNNKLQEDLVPTCARLGIKL